MMQRCYCFSFLAETVHNSSAPSYAPSLLLQTHLSECVSQDRYQSSRCEPDDPESDENLLCCLQVLA